MLPVPTPIEEAIPKQDFPSRFGTQEAQNKNPYDLISTGSNDGGITETAPTRATSHSVEDEETSDTSTTDDGNFPTPAEETYVVDPGGHLRVSLCNSDQDDEETATFLVSSRCLWRASSVWRSMIDASPLELKLSLPLDLFRACGQNDIHEIILLLFNVAHAKFDTLPDVVPGIRLWGIVLLCYKYDTVELLRPFFRDWVYPLFRDWPYPYFPDKLTINWRNVHDMEIWPFIFWVLGYQDAFESWTKAYTSTYSFCRYYITAQGDREYFAEYYINLYKGLSMSELVLTIKTHIHDVRRKLLHAMHSTCGHYAEYLSNWSVRGYCVHKDKAQRRTCDSLALGSFLIFLHTENIMPFSPLNPNRSKSVERLMQGLTSLKIETHPNHADCDINARFLNARFHKDIKSCLQRVEFLTDNQRQRFSTFKLREVEKSFPQWTGSDVLNFGRNAAVKTDGNP